MTNSSTPDGTIVYPAGMPVTPDTTWLSTALLPAAWLYRAALPAVAAYRRRRAATVAGARVISVGNLSVGGNGKTPFALWLLERERGRRARVAYVSRGFSGSAEKIDAVTLVPPVDEVGTTDPGVRVVSRNHRWLAHEIGDEAALVADRMPTIPVVVGRDKAAAVACAVERYEVDMIVVDDAFQSWSMGRDLDVVMVDRERPLANGRLIPAGPLREAPKALSRAHTIVVNAARDEHDIAAVKEHIGRRASATARWCGVRRYLALPSPNGDKVATLCSVARPTGFEADVISEGYTPRIHFRFPDHHRYTPSDIAAVVSHCTREGVSCVVTTEKDWVKLRPLGLGELDVVVSRLEMELLGDDPTDTLS